MAGAGDGVRQLSAILEPGSSEEEEEEEEEDEEEDEEEAALVQQPPLAWDVGATEQRLSELEQVSQALLAELSALETQMELEGMCQQPATAQGKQENKQLEPLSVAPTAPPALPKEMPPEKESSEEIPPKEDPPKDPPEEDPDPAQLHGQQLQDLQDKVSELLAEQQDLTAQVQELQRKNQELQDQLEVGQEEQQRLRAALGTSQRALSSFKRVSQLVTQDYCEAVQQLELEQDLRLHAEAFAHEMLVQQKEAKRQSRILLQGGGHSAQLLAALQEVARLSRALEEARQEQQQRVKELEEQLGRRPEPEELEGARAALAAVEAEKQQLKQRLAGLEEEVGLLQEKLAQNPAGQSRPPEPVPPPPPLPPPAPAVPTDPLLVIRQRKGLANRQHGSVPAAPGTGRAGAQDVRARAVQEMMERIRSGVVLRPAKERAPLGQELVASKRRSAALELQGILGARKRPSGRRSRRQSRAGQLEAILQRRRQALDASVPPSPAPTLSPSPAPTLSPSPAPTLSPSPAPTLSPSPAPTLPPSPTPGPLQRDQAGAGAAGDPEPGYQDAGTAVGSEAVAPFRARAGGGLPRTRPLTRPAGGSRVTGGCPPTALGPEPPGQGGEGP